jgi:uridine monophosphate synthetase
MNHSQIINKLIELECFKEGNFLLKSGKESKYYIDLRILVSYPEILKDLSMMLYEKIEDIDGNLCGLPYAGIPYVQTMSVINNRPMILLRKERKKHGTSKMIEGVIRDGDNLIIIDDILTSGTSIVESLEHLDKYNIKKILVIVDRNEGGRERLNELGYEVESLFSIEDFKNVNRTDFIHNIRNIISKKKSNICVSLDYIRTCQILNAIEILKDNIVMVKIHCDIIEDFNEDFVYRLTKICREYNIYIIEDRKFGDIGNTFKNQFTGGIFKIRDWANFVTFHGIVGEGQVKQFNELRYSNQYILLVAMMSNNGNLLNLEYTNSVLEIANNNKNSVIGMISQKSLTKADDYLYFTPGIKLENKNDNSDQIYNTPKVAIENGSDILIIGRGIINSSDILDSCKMYQKEAWKYYNK